MKNVSQDNIINLTNNFQRTPTISDVKKYVNFLVQTGKEFKTSNSDWFIDMKVTSRAKKHIIYANRWKNMSEAEKERHNKYIMCLDKLILSAEYIDENINIKKDRKSNIQKYYYFRTFVKINKNQYEVMIDTELYINEKEDKPQTVHLYNIHEIGKIILE